MEDIFLQLQNLTLKLHKMSIHLLNERLCLHLKYFHAFITILKLSFEALMKLEREIYKSNVEDYSNSFRNREVLGTSEDRVAGTAYAQRRLLPRDLGLAEEPEAGFRLHRLQIV